MTLVNKLMIKILNLKFVILLEYQNIKTFLQKTIFQVGLKRRFCDKKKLKPLCRGHVISGLKGEEIFGTFLRKKIAKTESKRV